MPIFDYRCSNCHFVAKDQFIHAHHENISHKCPKCGKIGMEKQPPDSNFVVKGYAAANSYGLKGDKK